MQQLFGFTTFGGSMLAVPVALRVSDVPFSLRKGALVGNQLSPLLSQVTIAPLVTTVPPAVNAEANGPALKGLEAVARDRRGPVRASGLSERDATVVLHHSAWSADTQTASLNATLTILWKNLRVH